ncbi:hypothetical protein EDB80DRAFT_681262 [Ilyonectria destructans]|nr:hypothetical protein EDB80DRAFT_681262 [Ilyonectria destructans]
MGEPRKRLGLKGTVGRITKLALYVRAWPVLEEPGTLDQALRLRAVAISDFNSVDCFHPNGPNPKEASDFSTFLDELDVSGHELWLLENDPSWLDGRTSQAGYDWEASGYNYHETPTITGSYDSLSLDCPTTPLSDIFHEALPPLLQGPQNQSTPDSSGSSLTPLVSNPVTPISSVRTTVCLAEVVYDTVCFKPQAGLPSVHATTSPATGDVLTSQSSDWVDCTRCPKQFSGTDKLSQSSTDSVLLWQCLSRRQVQVACQVMQTRGPPLCLLASRYCPPSSIHVQGKLYDSLQPVRAKKERPTAK